MDDGEYNQAVILHGVAAMSGYRLIAIAACAVSAVLVAFAGTDPAVSPSQYPAHTGRDGTSIGARLLTLDQVHHEIVSDLKQCCLVVEIAIYPAGNKPLPVSADDFALRISGSDEVAKPASSRLIASILEKKGEPARDVSASGSVGVGYETSAGRDPYGGTQRVSGVSKEAEVGVGVGGSGATPVPPDANRMSLELELSGKGLPEGNTAAPVAGYLYFPLSTKKQKKSPSYQLEYTLGGQKLALPLPQ